MKKKIILIPLIIVVGIIILSSLPWMIILILEPILQPIFPELFKEFSPECVTINQKIFDKSDELNYCTIDEDCAVFSDGCSNCRLIFINKKQINYSEELKELIFDYTNNCASEVCACLPFEGEIECINNKCVISEGS